MAALTARDAEVFERCMGVGGVAVFPADTVYGLACEPDSKEAVQRLYMLKRRAPDKPAASDHLMLWIANPVISTTDEAAGPKLNLADQSSGEEESEPKDDNGSLEALAKEFKAQRWDADKSAWK